VIFIQITLNEGRTLEMKQAFYQMLAERLHHDLGVRQEDVLINLVEVKKENWSFGNGMAQYPR
jgi:phenylpyruvate tautomerase PptA (4-oxalocrotonate tautomerase family)